MARGPSMLMLRPLARFCVRSTAFGAAGEGYLRFSYAVGTETIDEALRRIRALLS